MSETLRVGEGREKGGANPDECCFRSMSCCFISSEKLKLTSVI